MGAPQRPRLRLSRAPPARYAGRPPGGASSGASLRVSTPCNCGKPVLSTRRMNWTVQGDQGQAECDLWRAWLSSSRCSGAVATAGDSVSLPRPWRYTHALPVQERPVRMDTLHAAPRNTCTSLRHISQTLMGSPTTGRSESELTRLILHACIKLPPLLNVLTLRRLGRVHRTRTSSP